MSEFKAVSIIMPSLNVVDYIDEAINSVRRQTLRNIEILCIDAGSTDGTVEVIKRHAKEDERITFIHSDKKSYGYQLNLGIGRASGEYIGIVETDDYVEPDMYEKLYEIAVRDNCDFVKADYMAFITQNNGEKFFLTRKNFSDHSLYNKVINPKHHLEVATGDWYNCQGIYGLDFIKSRNITFSETPGAAFQDIGFLFYAIIYANKVEYITDSFYRYRIDRIESSSRSGRGIKYSYDEFKRLIDAIESSDEYDAEDYRVLYTRMAKSFLTSYGDMGSEYIRIKDDERQMYYSWFKQKMNAAIEKGLVSASDMHPSIWRGLNALLESEEKSKKNQEEREAILVTVLKKTTPSQVAIFGSGNYGYAAHCILVKHGLNNDFFVDNNKELWGKELDGVLIVGPQKLEEIQDEVEVIIANALYADEIKEQVLLLGVPENRIICWGNE